VLAFTASNARAQWKTPWSYSGARGPAHWAKLDRAYAACDGTAQSPIDIRNATKASLPTLRFEYKSGPVTIINNGYTAVRVNYAPSNGNFLIVGDKRYELTQFHFHHPSEEKLNGKSFGMVIHFMHQSSDGQVVGVAVFVRAGNPSAPFASVVRQLWDNMPPKASPEHTIAGLSLNPADLLPLDTAYYMYAGSQTAPPCTEGVTWFVLKTPVQIAPGKITAFAKLYPHDVRPVQPLNGRVVKKSE
jgi:carbonic anhydrase